MSMLFKRIKDWATSITAFRTGDVIPVDGPSGTAKMTKDNLLQETAENAEAQPLSQIMKLNTFLNKESLIFEQGGIDVDGTEIASTTRVRSGYIEADKFLAIVANMSNSGYRIYLYCYNENKEVIGHSIWESSTFVITKTETNYAGYIQPDYVLASSFYRLLISKTDNSRLSAEEASNYLPLIDVVYWNDTGKDSEKNREGIIKKILFEEVAAKYAGKVTSFSVSTTDTVDKSYPYNFVAGQKYKIYFAADDFCYVNQRGTLSKSMIKLSTGHQDALVETIYRVEKSERFFISDSVEFIPSQSSSWFNFVVTHLRKVGDNDEGSKRLRFLILEDGETEETLQESGFIENLYESLDKSLVKFYDGSIDEYGADTDKEGRIRTNKIYLDNIYSIKFKMPSGSQAYVYAYDSNDNFLGRSGWYSNDDFVTNIENYNGAIIPNQLVGAAYFRFVFKNDSTIIDKFYCESNIFLDIVYIDDNCLDARRKYISLSAKSSAVKLASYYPNNTYEFRVVDNSEEFAPQIDQNFGPQVKSGHHYKIGIFADDVLYALPRNVLSSSFVKVSTGASGSLIETIKVVLKSDKFYISDFFDFIASQDAPCFNLFVNVVSKISDGGLHNSKISVCVVDLDEDAPIYDYVSGAGQFSYDGAKIELKQNKFSAKTLMNLQGNVESHVMQAIAEHEGTLFVGYDSGYCITYEMSTGNKIAQFDFGGKVSSNHCGNLNFGKNYFAGNANFPALYVSGDLTNLCCYVESVTKTSSVLKQRIDFNLTTYKKANGSQVVVDNERGKIVYMQRTINDIYSLSNSLYCVEFDLPALTDGVLTDDVLVVTLTDADVTSDYELPEYKGVYQGAIINDGKLYQLHGHQNDGEGHYCGIMVFDITTNIMVSYVDVTPIISAEPQGIAMFKNGLIINWLTGNDPLYYFNF